MVARCVSDGGIFLTPLADAPLTPSSSKLGCAMLTAAFGLCYNSSVTSGKASAGRRVSGATDRGTAAPGQKRRLSVIARVWFASRLADNLLFGQHAYARVTGLCSLGRGFSRSKRPTLAVMLTATTRLIHTYTPTHPAQGSLAWAFLLPGRARRTTGA